MKGKKAKPIKPAKPATRKLLPPKAKTDKAQADKTTETAPQGGLAASAGEATPKKKGRPTNAERAAREAAKRIADMIARGEEIIVPQLPSKVFKAGERVETAPKCAVAGIIYKGTVASHSPTSCFVRVSWDDYSYQAHHVDTIVPSKSKKSRRSKKTMRNGVEGEELLSEETDNTEANTD